MKYLPWGLAILLAAVALWGVLGQSSGETIGTVNIARVVDESARAQELNQLLSDRYDELIAEFDLESEAEEGDTERADRERQAYTQYLAYRQELEVKFQAEVEKAVQEVARAKKVTVVVDDDVVRFGGSDLSDEVIKRLK
ncbi:MAG TPA: hypothetical protein GX521_01615 [Firmicutes bacterium]|nr:hypothetical protein [Bacillota bacterium]